MKAINISSEDKITFRDFNEGNSVQVRVAVREDEVETYTKGATVKVVHEGTETSARIVSDPLVVNGNPAPDEQLLSLIVVKA
jgi:hypothetical protein